MAAYFPVGFSGARRLSAAGAVGVAELAPLFVPSGAPVLVGCAGGVDKVIRGLFPSAEVLAVSSGAWGSGPGAFVGRSVALVGALAPGGLLVAFPSVPCPVGILPAPTWRSGRPASGTWSTAALAAGRGVGLVIVALGGFALPAWPGGAWRPSPVAAVAWAWVPELAQSALF